MFLVLIETSSNQRYIFSSNKLRENVGASELTYQIGTTVVRGIIENRTDVKEIITTSGKALLLADDAKVAKELIREVTKHALTEMPGLTVYGAIYEIKDETEKSGEKRSEAENLHAAVGMVHERLDKLRQEIPTNLQRFQRLPFAAQCASTNLPANMLFKHHDMPPSEKMMPHSAVSLTKQNHSDRGKNRLENSVKKHEPDLHFARNINALDRKFADTNWLAVIHADGNGLGKIFLDFQRKTSVETAEEYIASYNKFSKGLDECTEKAAAFALKNLRDKIGYTSIEIPAIPLVLGGDDLTIICDGKYAINFTRDFLLQFVEELNLNEKIKEVFPGGIDLGICAGIAIIKPNFPFHQAYHLAEELLQSAKKTKQISPSISAFDYHVLYDSSGTTLGEIRAKTPFVARPYIVTDEAAAKSFVDTDNKENRAKNAARKEEEKIWIGNHHFDRLKQRVEAMTEKDEDEKNKLPNSQLHVLREGLYTDDKVVAIQREVDARAKLIAHRYESFKGLFVNDETLFFEEVLLDKTDDREETKRTHFLDALDIAEFWK